MTLAEIIRKLKAMGYSLEVTYQGVELEGQVLAVDLEDGPVAEISLERDNNYVLFITEEVEHPEKLLKTIRKFAQTPLMDRQPLTRKILVVGNIAYKEPLYLSYQRSKQKLVLAAESLKDKDLQQLFSEPEIRKYLRQARDHGDYGSDLLDFLGVAVNSAFLESGANQDEED